MERTRTVREAIREELLRGRRRHVSSRKGSPFWRSPSARGASGSSSSTRPGSCPGADPRASIRRHSGSRRR